MATDKKSVASHVIIAVDIFLYENQSCNIA